MSKIELGPVSWERIIRAVEKVRERLLRATAALERAGIAYAIVRGNAMAVWVARVDEAAVRNNKDVEILIRRIDMEATKAALAAAGFVFRHLKNSDMFLDGPDAKARDSVRRFFSGEKVRPEDPLPAPDVSESEAAEKFRVLALDALVRMSLTTFKLNDMVDLRDMLDVGLIDATWCQRLTPELAARLQHILDTPEG